MNTGRTARQCLENEGVEYIFGLPGEEKPSTSSSTKTIFHSVHQLLATSRVRPLWLTCTAGLPVKQAVCLSTLGPGATNLMTGVADANLDRAPLVAITGQVGTDRMHIESHQYLDLVAMFAPVTKWNKQIVRPNTTPEIVRKAFKISQSEPPGAVHIDLPENIAGMVSEGKPLRVDVSGKPVASDESLQKACDRNLTSQQTHDSGR